MTMLHDPARLTLIAGPCSLESEAVCRAVAERLAELERRIFRLLKEGDPDADVTKVLDLSDRDAARVLNRMESLESSDVFLLKPLLEEAQNLIKEYTEE